MICNLKVRFHTGFMFFLSFILSFTVLSAQVTDYAGMAEKARSEFVNGRYGEALVYYRELKALFRQNPEYQYYIGRSLLKLDQYAEETIDNLRFAAIKGDMDDAWFFLGKAYHLNGEYEKAVHAYQRFMALGKKSDIRQLKVKELLDMAENESKFSSGKLPMVASRNNKDEKKEEISDVNEKNNEMSSGKSTAVNEALTEAESVNYMEKTSVENNRKIPDDASDEKAVDKNMLQQNDANLIKALDLQLIADSLNRTARMKRDDLKETELSGDRNELIVEISHLEKESRKIQKEADDLFISMRKSTLNESMDDTIRDDEIIELKDEINGIKVYQYKADAFADKDHFASRKTETSEDEENKNEKMDAAGNELLFPDRCIYSGNNPIPARYHYPDKLVYHIQLGVFSKKAGHDSFGT
ncbi:MAG TPA: hypothetical protein VJ346_07090, partial [Bacteroidales bacterium]|nr:hypothetical protein [Bacteroidales bacterium]